MSKLFNLLNKVKSTNILIPDKTVVALSTYIGDKWTGKNVIILNSSDSGQLSLAALTQRINYCTVITNCGYDKIEQLLTNLNLSNNFYDLVKVECCFTSLNFRYFFNRGYFNCCIIEPNFSKSTALSESKEIELALNVLELIEEVIFLYSGCNNIKENIKIKNNSNIEVEILEKISIDIKGSSKYSKGKLKGGKEFQVVKINRIA